METRRSYRGWEPVRQFPPRASRYNDRSQREPEAMTRVNRQVGRSTMREAAGFRGVQHRDELVAAGVAYVDFHP